MGSPAGGKRRRRLIAAAALVVACIIVFFGYMAGLIVPPTPVQWLQTRGQTARYDDYPKPEGMERIEVERYTRTFDTFGPRAGRVRYVYSIPDGWTGQQLIAWLRQAAPEDLHLVDDSTCAELVSAGPPTPPPTTAGGAVMEPDPVDHSTLLDEQTSVTLLDSSDWRGDGLTFRLRSNNTEPQPASLELPPLGIDPDEDIVVVADHPRFACG